MNHDPYTNTHQIDTAIRQKRNRLLHLRNQRHWQKDQIGLLTGCQFFLNFADQSKREGRMTIKRTGKILS